MREEARGGGERGREGGKKAWKEGGRECRCKIQTKNLILHYQTSDAMHIHVHVHVHTCIHLSL